MIRLWTWHCHAVTAVLVLILDHLTGKPPIHGCVGRWLGSRVYSLTIPANQCCKLYWQVIRPAPPLQYFAVACFHWKVIRVYSAQLHRIAYLAWQDLQLINICQQYDLQLGLPPPKSSTFPALLGSVHYHEQIILPYGTAHEHRST